MDITRHRNIKLRIGCRPNPFNPSTVISFDLPYGSDVTINIFDVTGRLVSNLFSGNMSPGKHDINWDSKGRAGGIYLCRITAGENSGSVKLTLIK